MFFLGLKKKKKWKQISCVLANKKRKQQIVWGRRLVYRVWCEGQEEDLEPDYMEYQPLLLIVSVNLE